MRVGGRVVELPDLGVPDLGVLRDVVVPPVGGPARLPIGRIAVDRPEERLDGSVLELFRFFRELRELLDQAQTSGRAPGQGRDRGS